MHLKDNTMKQLLWFILGFSALVWTWWRFKRWEIARSRALSELSHIAETAYGPMEYQLMGEGPVILVLHGTPGGYDQGLLVAPHLIEAGFSVLTISRPGYLRTPLATGKTIEATADAIAGLLDVLQIEQVGLCGLSGGGPFALQVALRHPERVWALEMACAVSLPYDPSKALKSGFVKAIFRSSAMQGVAFLLFDWLMHHWPRWTIPIVMRQIVHHDDPGYVKTLTQQVLADPNQVRWLQQNIRTTVPYRLRQIGYQHELALFRELPAYSLHQINAPTLVIHSRYDGDVAFTHGQHTVTQIPNAELFAVDGAGHLLWLGDEGKRVRAREQAFFQQYQ